MLAMHWDACTMVFWFPGINKTCESGKDFTYYYVMIL